MAAPTTEECLQGLLDFGLASIDAATVGDVAIVMAEQAAPLVGAANAAVAVLNRAGDAIRVFQGPTSTAGTSPIRLVGLHELTPLTDAVRDRCSVMVHSAEEFAERYPRIASRIEPAEVTTMATYALCLGDDILGACFFRFANDTPVGDLQYELMDQMVPLIARAVSRIQDRRDLVRHAEQLQQSNRDLDNFAAVVAHDLSAPVRRIGSYLQLLLRELPDSSPKAERFAQVITTQVTHLDELLKDTLAYAQVALPTGTRERVQLADLVDNVVEPMAAEISESGATTLVHELPIVDVEASLIQAVFQNLFDNAIKYRSPDRALRIEVAAEFERLSNRENRQWWKISFADSGIGIDPDRVDEVFAMFARLEVTEDKPGTGVGLAFVKRVVERHGGEVGIAPGIDGGTTIWFTLPGIAAHDEL